VYKYTETVDVADALREDRPLVIAPSRPNPVTSSTRVPFFLGAEAHVRVTVRDVQGRTLLTLFEGIQPAGRSEIAWNARDHAGNRMGPGIYWCCIETPTAKAATKLLVVR